MEKPEYIAEKFFEPTSGKYEELLSVLVDAMAEIEKRDALIIEQGKEICTLNSRLKEKDKEIAALKEKNVALRNVIRSDEEQIKNFIERNAEMRDDCIETARQRDLITQEKDKEIAKLKDELECYKLSPDEKTKLISSWQKRSFEFEDELSRLTATLNDNERVEKVAQSGRNSFGDIVDSILIKMWRESAINDYRAEMLKEVGT